MPASIAFHDVRFPTAIAFGATGGPERRTDVVTLYSGSEERNSRWADSRRSYNAGYGIRTLDDLHAVIAFFEERRGRLTGFRWKDRADWKSCAPGGTPAATDQTIGVGDGATKTFQLIKTYGATYAPWTREIKKPVAGTVLIALDEAPQASGWSVDTTTGIVTFDSAPSSSVAITAGFEFDVPVRFDSDRLEINLSHFDAGSIPAIPIVELRLATAVGSRQRRRFDRDCPFSDHSMRTLDSGLAAHVATGCTTLCTCWKVTLANGSVLGFTDHDRALAFDGVDYEPESGFTASEFAQHSGLSVDTMEVDGALSSSAIDPDDLMLGVWDNARVDVTLVNWADVSQRLLLRRTSIGEVSRLGTLGFKAELRGLAHQLDQETGRTYQRQCDVKQLGDARCKVNTASSFYRGSGTVTAVDDDRIIYASGLASFPATWFTFGTLTWTSGANDGVIAEIRAHGLTGSTAAITLWRRTALPVAVGNTFAIVAGCDRTFDMCLAQVPQQRQLPRLPPHPRQRLRPRRRQERRGERRRELLQCVRWVSNKRRGARNARPGLKSCAWRGRGSARPTGTRPRSRAWPATASAWRAASGARSTPAATRRRCRPIPPTGRRPPAGRPCSKPPAATCGRSPRGPTRRRCWRRPSPATCSSCAGGRTCRRSTAPS